MSDGTVRAARDEYLRANGFSVDGYTAPTFQLPFLRWKVTLRNPPSRQEVVPWHDLHHVATGYGTDFIGEAEIGAWELRAGCNRFILYLLNGLAVLFGLCLSPRRVAAAWRRARGQKTLYDGALDYEALLARSVPELRGALGLPAAGAGAAVHEA